MVRLAIADLLLPDQQRVRERATRVAADGLDLGFQLLELVQAEQEELVLGQRAHGRRARLVQRWRRVRGPPPVLGGR